MVSVPPTALQPRMTPIRRMKATTKGRSTTEHTEERGKKRQRRTANGFSTADDADNADEGNDERPFRHETRNVAEEATPDGHRPLFISASSALSAVPLSLPLPSPFARTQFNHGTHGTTRKATASANGRRHLQPRMTPIARMKATTNDIPARGAQGGGRGNARRPSAVVPIRVIGVIRGSSAVRRYRSLSRLFASFAVTCRCRPRSAGYSSMMAGRLPTLRAASAMRVASMPSLAPATG